MKASDTTTAAVRCVLEACGLGWHDQLDAATNVALAMRGDVAGSAAFKLPEVDSDGCYRWADGSSVEPCEACGWTIAIKNFRGTRETLEFSHDLEEFETPVIASPQAAAMVLFLLGRGPGASGAIDTSKGLRVA